ncbi:MAG: hypothetical protein ACP5UU_05885 [Thermoprotei archaeon]
MSILDELVSRGIVKDYEVSTAYGSPSKNSTLLLLKSPMSIDRDFRNGNWAFEPGSIVGFVISCLRGQGGQGPVPLGTPRHGDACKEDGERRAGKLGLGCV